MPIVLVSNGASTPSGGKRWRWEDRDPHGHLVDAGEWQTNPARAVRLFSELKAEATARDPEQPDRLDRSAEVPGRHIGGLLGRARADLAP